MRAFRRGLVVVLEVGVIALTLVLAVAIWIFIHALDATGRLSDARTDIQRVRADLIIGRNATEDMYAAQADAAAAKRDTHDFVWRLASWVPPVKTVQGITTAIDTLAAHALPDVVRVGPTLRPAVLRVAHNKIALAPLAAAAPTMRRAAAAATLARAQIQDLPSGGIGLVADARKKVLAELTSLAGSIDDISRFTTAGPAMLGANGPRRYFVGIQNNAEARATGGLVAAYAIVTANHGVIHVAEHGNDLKLNAFFAPKPVLTLGADYRHEYGNYLPAQLWTTSNLSPNFPDAANIWAHLWEAQSGQHIDGSFGVDPVGLAKILGAVGPVTVKGYPGVYTGSNLASFIEAKEYAEFAGVNNNLRKNFLAKVGTAAMHKMLSGSGNPQAIASALGSAAGAGHLSLWSGRSEEQAQISGTPLARELTASTAPFASVSVDNATGSKLDYYLDRSLHYEAGTCNASRRDSTITVTLTNNAPIRGLPAYVRYVLTSRNTGVIEKVPNNSEYVFIHATAGSALLGATLNGKSVPVGAGLEQGHPVFLLKVQLRPEVPATIRIRLSEPVVPGAATTLVQPLARPQQTELDVPKCG